MCLSKWPQPLNKFTNKPTPNNQWRPCNMEATPSSTLYWLHNRQCHRERPQCLQAPCQKPPTLTLLVDHINHGLPENGQQLTDRILWADGISSWDPDYLVANRIKLHTPKYVSHITEQVAQYNRLVPPNRKLVCRSGPVPPIPTSWTIPANYQHLDIITYVSRMHAALMLGVCSQAEFDLRERRLAKELLLYHRLGLFDVLRGISWFINTLQAHNVVWGVGRGSSVASYVLYVIGVHDVDSFRFDLDIEDFLH